MMRILVGLAALLVTVSLVLALGKQPQPFPEESLSATLLRPGAHDVTQFNIELIDVSRPTQANGDYPGSPERRMTATIWHQEIVDYREPEPGPLLIFSHGFSSSREGGAYLGELLASIGYVVIAVDYPLTHMGAPGGPQLKDVVNQPADISFLIDTLLSWSADAGHTMAGLIDPLKIGVTGISLGGMTTTLVAYHPEMADPRVAAALSIAGPTEQFTPAFFRHRPELPFLMLAADQDAMVPYLENAERVLADIPGSQLVTVRGGSHTGFSGPAGALRWLDNPDSLGCYIVSSRVESATDEPWFDLIGTPEQGINYHSENRLCQIDPLPATINPLRQQMITAAVVRSFFASHFADNAEDRRAARDYLATVLDAEIPEADWRAAAL